MSRCGRRPPPPPGGPRPGPPRRADARRHRPYRLGQVDPATDPRRLLLPQESGVSWKGTALEAITEGAGPLRRSSTSALDEATTHRVVAHLRELVDDGVGVLTATHDPLLIEAAGTVMPLH